ncbi:porin [Salinisphaera sp. T31B1]|uniref:OprO/OprP family phosphate-selective porin n=1 Tax=Salinisphaera sp. T31B1 TaxID=727963 RepID=UPI0033400A3B
MKLDKYWRASVMTAVVASASVYVPSAWAQQPSNAELADLVRQQAAQIQRLEQRIQALESDKRPAAQASAAAAPDQPSRPATRAGKSAPSEPSVAALRKDVDQLKNNSVQVNWKSGSPEFSSRDGEFTFAPLGRIQYDYSTTSGSRFPQREIDGSEFRRLRLGVQGQLMEPILYKLEFDFAGSDVAIRDAYIAGKRDFELGQGVVYLGNKFNDRSLSGATSSKYIWFLERNTVADAVIPETGSYYLGGTTAFYGEQNYHLSLAVAKGSLDGGNTDSDNLTVLSRGHFNPWLSDRGMLHIGAWGFYEDFSRGRIDSLTDNYRVASHFNDNTRIYADTVTLPETSTGYGFELAGLAGRFAAAAEYGRRDIDSRVDDDTHYDAYSGQVGFSLTGEPFGYSAKSGVWNAPKVDRPVGHGGWGAWQVMARYDALDYDNSGAYAGGTGYATTLGMSWWLNDYTRFMLNYIDWNTNNRIPIAGAADGRDFTGADDGQTISARAQVIF